VNKGISKVESILKTVMSPIEPAEGYVENYILLIGDRHKGNFTRLLELKGIKKPEQNPLIDMFQRRLTQHDNLVDNSFIIPPDMPYINNASLSSSAANLAASNTLPSSITTSLSTIASSAASNFNAPNSPFRNTSPTNLLATSPTEGTRGRLNENFRKLVMTGMAFRKDLQERREHSQN
jgi:hypothetical protein